MWPYDTVSVDTMPPSCKVRFLAAFVWLCETKTIDGYLKLLLTNTKCF